MLCWLTLLEACSADKRCMAGSLDGAGGLVRGLGRSRGPLLALTVCKGQSTARAAPKVQCHGLSTEPQPKAGLLPTVLICFLVQW